MPQPGCYLEWSPWTRDRACGLSHQLSSLSCALAEAHYVGRTLLLPRSGLCSGSHGARWHAGASNCVAWDALLDIDELSRMVPASTDPIVVPNASTVSVGANWSSLAVGTAFACDRAGAPVLVRRRVATYWFDSCTHHRTNSQQLARHVHATLRLKHRSVRLALNHRACLLCIHLRLAGQSARDACLWAVVRKGAQAGRCRHSMAARRELRVAARAPLRPDQDWVRARPRLRRADAALGSRTRTRPLGKLAHRDLALSTLEHRISRQVPNGSDVYVGSDEPPAFFAPLGDRYR